MSTLSHILTQSMSSISDLGRARKAAHGNCDLISAENGLGSGYTHQQVDS